MRILLDCDNVLADYTASCAEFARLLVPNRAQDFRQETITQWDIWAAWGIKHLEPEFMQHAAEPGFCAAIPVINGAQELLAGLQALGEVAIVTSPLRTPTWCYERVEWLQRCLGFTGEVVFRKKKFYEMGDVLIDDSAEHCQQFAATGRVAALVDQPWNREYVGGECFTAVRCFSNAEILNLCEYVKSHS